MKTFDYESIDLSEFEAQQESQFLLPASSWRGEVKDRILKGVELQGDALPWPKTQGQFRLRPGEVTLWYGYSQHKKSMVVGQVILWLLENCKAVIASMEMPPAATIERLVYQAAGTDQVSVPYYDWIMDWTDDRLWLYDESDTVEPQRIIAMVNYAAKVLKVQHVAVDSLMKCVRGEDDYNGQKDFVDQLCQAAKRHSIHIHLVHHARKGQGKDSEDTPPSKHDARGASAITDLVDNTIAVHSNVKKERAVKEGNDYDPNEIDTTLYVWKQRHGAMSGHGFGLYWDASSRQLVQGANSGPMEWIPGQDWNIGRP